MNEAGEIAAWSVTPVNARLAIQTASSMRRLPDPSRRGTQLDELCPSAAGQACRERTSESARNASYQYHRLTRPSSVMTFGVHYEPWTRLGQGPADERDTETSGRTIGESEYRAPQASMTAHRTSCL